MDDADDQVAARRTHSAGGELGIREPTTDDPYVPYAHSEPRRFPLERPDVEVRRRRNAPQSPLNEGLDP